MATMPPPGGAPPPIPPGGGGGDGSPQIPPQLLMQIMQLIKSGMPPEMAIEKVMGGGNPRLGGLGPRPVRPQGPMPMKPPMMR